MKTVHISIDVENNRLVPGIRPGCNQFQQFNTFLILHILHGFSVDRSYQTYKPVGEVEAK